MIVTTNDKHYGDIADAIRDKLGTTDGYKPEDMAAAVGDIESGGGGPTVYTISCNETNPNIFLYAQHGVAGDTILTHHFGSEFMFFDMTIKDASNNTISYTKRDRSCWYFTMPASNVTITVDYF